MAVHHIASAACMGKAKTNGFIDSVHTHMTSMQRHGIVWCMCVCLICLRVISDYV